MKPPVKITATEVHRHFSDLIRRAVVEKEHFLIEKDGLPVIVMLSVEDYAALVQEKEQRAQEVEDKLKRFRENMQAIGAEFERLGLTEEEALAQFDEFRKERRRNARADQ